MDIQTLTNQSRTEDFGRNWLKGQRVALVRQKIKCVRSYLMKKFSDSEEIIISPDRSAKLFTDDTKLSNQE